MENSVLTVVSTITDGQNQSLHLFTVHTDSSSNIPSTTLHLASLSSGRSSPPDSGPDVYNQLTSEHCLSQDVNSEKAPLPLANAKGEVVQTKNGWILCLVHLARSLIIFAAIHQPRLPAIHLLPKSAGLPR